MLWFVVLAGDSIDGYCETFEDACARYEPFEVVASNPHGAIRSYNGILADSYRTGERYFVQEIVEPPIRTFDVTDQGALHERA